MESLKSCPLCGASGPFEVHVVSRDYLVSQEMYSVHQCGGCGFLFTNPRPTADEMSDFYQSDEYISHAVSPESLQDKVYMGVKQLMLKQKLRLLSKHLNQVFGMGLSGISQNYPSEPISKPHEQPGNQHENVISPVKYMVLDYGCGTGSFVYSAMKEGINAIGFEPDPSAREVAAQQGIRVIGSEYEMDSFADQSFHAITLWHVVEHLHDFKKKLIDFYRLLKPRGVLVLAAPMANSKDAKLYGKYWAAWDLPRHLLHFTPATLKRAGRDAGFHFKEMKPLPFDAWYIALLSEQNKQKERRPEKKTRGPAVIPVLNAGARGCWSNLKAMIGTSPWSSQIFVFRK